MCCRVWGLASHYSQMWRLTNQIMSFGQSSTIADKLRDLCENLHSDERSLLEHHSKLIDFEDKYAENLAKFEAKEIADCI